MFKHRFFPYVIGACVLVILAVFFVGARDYMRQTEVKLAAEARAIEKTILESEAAHGHNHDHAHGEYDQTEKPILESDTPHEHNHTSAPGEYDQNRWYTQVAQGNQENQEQFQLELDEWYETGKLTPLVENYFKMLEIWAQQSENAVVTDVIQRIVTPDGTLRQVVVPKRNQYEEGDAMLKSEIVDEEYLRACYRSKEANPPVPVTEYDLKGGPVIMPNGETYPMPDEYYEIEDSYERQEYANKFGASLELGISMDEIEQKIARGELDMSLSESQKRMVDEREAMNGRARLSYQIHMLVLPKMPPLSDKPPVKVRFLPDEGQGAKRGWMRKAQRKQDSLGDAPQPQTSEHERGIDDTHRSASPELPSERAEQERSAPSKQAMEDLLTSSPESLETLIKAQISPEERMKAIFSEKLSPEHDDPDEKLRRLRESDSEGAKQRERHNNHADDPPPAR